ncbi:hypothetical protein NLI96_g1481 [Meripilus lineatus]|uniref:F-box domain-containing protein n=1 Tax=Meripilus lineatus TaxID=2056292 RepID=A0AAD5YIC8_9APHY|nr:hypothetical protein NLI96_g1481 [Physisporinus lineatus]
MATAIKTALEGVSFPQIRTVVLPLTATAVLRSCPNVTRIALHHYGYGDPLRIIRDFCPRVEILQGLPFTAKVVKALLKAAPAVRELGFEIDHYNETHPDPQPEPDLSLLPELKNLSVVRIDNFDIKDPRKKKFLFDGLRNALSKIKTKEDKRIVVSYSIPPHNSENTTERERTEIIVIE